MIASWPDHIEPGTRSDHVSAFWDVMPTLCEIAGVDAPEDTDGLSFLPSLTGNMQPKHEYLYWEFPEYGGQQAVRMGKWKAVRMDIKKGNMTIQLFNLETDPQEQTNLADQFPELVQKAESIMKKEHSPALLDRFKMEQLGDVSDLTRGLGKSTNR
jgi:arylsulfatase